MSTINILTKGKFLCFVTFAFTVLFSSCISNKNVRYFEDVPDSSKAYKVSEYQYSEPVIQPDDILSISIQTIDPQTSNVMNQLSNSTPSISTGSSSPVGQQLTSGFLVDKEGQVEVPVIGKIQLGGLTTFKARDLIREKAAFYFKNPIVLVRYTNYKVTILGEVAKPGTYTLPNEKVSVLDAIGLAGDLTIYGKRTNVLLIREKAGVKEFTRFNLNSTNVFKSPYYHLRQNDILYIEPNKAKVATLNAARTQAFTIAASILTLLIIISTRIQF